MEGPGVQKVQLLPEYELPLKPEQDLRVEFVWGHLDDETGHLTAQAQEHSRVGCFPLETIDQEESIVLFGCVNPFEHDIWRVPLNNHSHGMTFQVKCTNLAAQVKGTILWKRSFTARDLKTALLESEENVLEMQGTSPHVPNLRCVGKGTLTIASERGGTLHVKGFNLTLSYDAYNAWLDAVKK